MEPSGEFGRSEDDVLSPRGFPRRVQEDVPSPIGFPKRSEDDVLSPIRFPKRAEEDVRERLDSRIGRRKTSSARPESPDALGTFCNWLKNRGLSIFRLFAV